MCKFCVVFVLAAALVVPSFSQAITCQVNAATKDSYCNDGPEMFCGNNPYLLKDKTANNLENINDNQPDVCKLYDPEKLCPNRPSEAEPCPSSISKKRYCYDGIIACKTDDDCVNKLLPCYDTCYPCQTETECQKRVDQKLLAGEDITECSSASMFIPSFALAALFALCALLF